MGRISLLTFEGPRLNSSAMDLPLSTANLIQETREHYRALWGRVGQMRDCEYCQKVTHHRDDGHGEWLCVPCMEARLESMVDAFSSRCSLCGSAEHDACGFCSACKDHATADRLENDDLVTDCCGAMIWEYDYDPT